MRDGNDSNCRAEVHECNAVRKATCDCPTDTELRTHSWIEREPSRASSDSREHRVDLDDKLVTEAFTSGLVPSGRGSQLLLRLWLDPDWLHHLRSFASISALADAQS